MMDLFPVDTNIAAYSHSFVEHVLVVAGRVFEVPFEVYDRFAAQDQRPFQALHYWVHSPNVKVVVSVPKVLFVEQMEDLNLFHMRKIKSINFQFHPRKHKRSFQ